MSKKHKAKTHSEKMKHKKAAVLGSQNKSKTPLIIASVALVLLIGGTAAYIGLGNTNTVSATASSSAPSASTATHVSYPVSQFNDGQARHFEYKTSDGITVKYFILKSSDGIIRAAFDACDVCWPSGKGYYQDGDHMVCRNCGRRFASVLVNEVKGGCNPAPLTRTVQGEQLVLQVNDILEGRQYFNFSGKA
ncbi:hypothetical protein D3OALGA1CA_2503 [Olavius algarvensis associated proteobacterium Delta 3]|nr:hypothetical protein D3OALGA1CA_2503 [Olavius algarvensis associated proteobacterium Delta 3]CAB5137712.1 hypothetical protein D3OALGB2SA_4038 [Olavius algarvensis associated proteobacterium Delta 3]